jgi:hypothetical protein
MAAFEELVERVDEEEGGASGFFAGLTESAEIVIAQAGEDASGAGDSLLVSLRTSDLVAEYIDCRTDHGERALQGSALDGARKVREDLVVALKIVNAALMRAEAAALASPKFG